VKVLRARARAFALPLARPLPTAHGSIVERRGWLVALEDEHGLRGLGEATPLPDFGTEDTAVCEAALERGIEALLSAPPGGLEEGLERLTASCSAARCARSALDTALHDLEARRRGISLATLLRAAMDASSPPRSSIEVQALVSGVGPEHVRLAAERAREAGHRCFKLKLAVSQQRRGIAADLERVAALRAVVGPKARLRLDANEAWSRDEALEALERLAPFDVDFVEQPVARDDLGSLAWLDRHAPVKVAADEALLGEGLEACLAARAASIFIVKPGALGGLAPSMDLAARAHPAGIRLVVSSLIDGAIGREAAIAFAAAIDATAGPDDAGPVGEVHGLGTGALLARDLVSRPGRGRLGLAEGQGLGGVFASLANDFFELPVGAADVPPWIGRVKTFEASP